MPHDASLWSETLRVRSYEMDMHGHAKIQVVCNYLQEAASNHAAALQVSVERLRPEGLAWVLARLHVQVESYPTWGQTIRIETWPSGVDELTATRDFLIYDEEDTVLVRATSSWMVIQLENKRPVRMPKFVRDLERPERAPAIKETFQKIAPPSKAIHQSSFAVRYSDLDLNAHVNNTRYVEWIVESMPERILRQHQMAELELQFRNESRYGDTIQARARQLQQGDILIFAHSLVTAAEQRLVATARTHWR